MDDQRLEADRRFEVAAPDGTALAVWVDGNGSPIVLVHGSLCDHTRFDPLVAELRDHATTFAMDRRGYGASADAPRHELEREFEDVAAVVDAVAARTGSPVTLWGHSYGAGCAMGGAARSNNVRRLVLYEPGLGLQYPAGSIELAEKALAAGDVESAIRAVFISILEMTEDDFEAIRQSPLWPVRVAAAPLLPRECRVEEGWSYDTDAVGPIAAPTELLLGSDSPAAIQDLTRRASAAIPGSQIRALDGHGHFAFQTDPALVASILLESTVAGT